MKIFLKVIGAFIALVLVIAGGTFFWAKSAAEAKLGTVYEVHHVEVPMPFPLSTAEVEALRKERLAARAKPVAAAAAGPEGEAAEAEGKAQGEEAVAAEDPLEGVDLQKIARQRAIARGKHLVEARYACIECHGKNFGGGVMVDDPAMGKLMGPNITGGKGGKTRNYKPADWDRIVRHGVKPDGTPAVMPSEDFRYMTDQELSDIVTYIRTVPAVDNEVGGVAFGPVGTILVATGELPLSADTLAKHHHEEHVKFPPKAEASEAFGKHLAAVCVGCHRENFEGGPIAIGPPDWPPAKNITMHEEGLDGWTFEQFEALMLTGVRPDGGKVLAPMNLMMPYANATTAVERRAMWEYLKALPPRPTGK
ncbi:MAG: cytochrome c [Myxococcales bacterium]|nr:cytochrome c [Myxococcales bacterium]